MIDETVPLDVEIEDELPQWTQDGWSHVLGPDGRETEKSLAFRMLHCDLLVGDAQQYWFYPYSLTSQDPWDKSCRGEYRDPILDEEI